MAELAVQTKRGRMRAPSVAFRFNGLETIKDLKHTTQAHPVEDLRPALVVIQNSGILQNCEMPRNRWHFDADHFREFAHAAFAA